LWAELQKEVLASVPHRHVVLTMPRQLRGIFRRRRELLLDLSQCSAEALSEYLRREVGVDTRPGIVVSVSSAGDLLQWHPHGHILVSDGAFSDDGAFHPLQTWDGDAVMKLFRERLLARLIERHAISEELARKLLDWRHPGFSAHLGEPIPFEDKKAIEDVACYMVRAPLSLKKLVYLDGQKAVLYRSRMNPFLGRNFEAMDPLEWLARLADHIPDAASTGPILTASTPVGSGPREERKSDGSSPRRRRRRRGAVRRAGRGSSARSTRRTRSSAKAAEVRSGSWRTSPTSCLFGASWTIWA
jgi:hypothetical protein